MQTKRQPHLPAYNPPTMDKTPKMYGCHRYGVDRFTVKLMISMSYRYANMLNRCVEDHSHRHTRLRNALFFLARSFLKKLLMAFLPAQLRAICVICVYFDQLYSQISRQSKISIANIHKTRYLLSGICLGDNFCHAQKMCARDPKWLRP